MFHIIPEDFVAPRIDYGLFLIERDLDRRGQNCADFGIPSLILNWEAHRVNHLISDELAYDPGLEAKFHLEKIGS